MKFTLKQARNYAGLTQEEVAKKLGISTLTYSKYERGKSDISAKQAKKFSKLVGIEMDNLIFSDDKAYVS